MTPRRSRNSAAVLGVVAALAVLFAAHARAAGEGDAMPPHGGAADPHEGDADAGDADQAADGNEKAFKPVVSGPMDFSAAEMIAVQEGGRKKPLHTYVTEKIQQLVGKPIFPFGITPYLTDKNTNEKIYAMDLFFSIMFRTRDWNNTPVVLINYGPLLDEMKLPRTEKHFTKKEIQRSQPYKKLLVSTMEKRHQDREKDLTDMEKEAELVEQRIEILDNIYNGLGTLAIVPHPSDPGGRWMSVGDLVESFDPTSEHQYYSKAQVEKIKLAVKTLFEAYRTRDEAKFTEASRSFKGELLNLSPTIYPSYNVLEREVTYNNLRPFGWAWIFYLLAVIVGVTCFSMKSKFMYGLVFSLASIGIAFHVYGFVLRCLIAGRPPVSNMYESVVWVGFGAVFFSMIFELIYRKKYFMLCGATAGFLCLVLMDMLPIITGNSETPGFTADVKPIQPVLRNNFWLTIHVLTITLSYAAFMLTCILGHVTLVRHLIDPAIKDVHRELHQFVYRAMQVGVLLIACGTILGGVWAYYSWGRFWGWDPKETGAFITLMCYLVVLHGRFTGWWGNFGLSLGSVLCFNSVIFAWYGVNFWLGKGLHAYGFGSGAQGWWVLGGVITDVLFVAVVIVRHVSYRQRLKDQSAKLTPTDPVDEVRKLGADGEASAPAHP